jgi:hypothetical protein
MGWVTSLDVADGPIIRSHPAFRRDLYFMAL